MTDNHLFTIFGGTGDLARRKLIPAFFELMKHTDQLGQVNLLGVANRRISDDEYRSMARDAIVAAGNDPGEVEAWCDECLHYQCMQEGFEALADRIETIEEDHGFSGNRVLYLALPPRAFAPTLEGLGEVGLNNGPGWTRLVVEKPFGRDSATAHELNEAIHRYFDETQVFRIDHYLGKETVQNLLVFRFANALFESSWNRDRIEHVQITVAEDVGAEGRGRYYDKTGALRDMVQSHLTQVMALIAMEPPIRFDADAIRNEKVKVLAAIEDIRPRDVVFGQYTSGSVDGEEVPGYRDDPDVDDRSLTETSVALRVRINNWRWEGVPFYLRTGKRYPLRLTQIVVTFRQPPVSFFYPEGQAHPNVLIMTLQPDEGFQLLFGVKRPADELVVETMPFRFSYEDTFGRVPDAYETLLYDVIGGDQTLFVRGDEVEEAWRLYEPLLNDDRTMHEYPAGSWGPAAADGLLSPYEWFVSASP